MQRLPSFEELKQEAFLRPVSIQPKTTSVIKPVKVEKRLRVCAYCRVSTNHEEQQSSIIAQTRHFASILAEHPEWENAGLYVDVASGTKKEKRPELQRMLADCKAGRISLILTKSISRFARNTSDLLEMVRTLVDMGVAIIFERENIDTRTMGTEFLLSILAALAEDESHSISSNCRWGMRKRFMDGSYRVSTAPYGYDVVDGNFVVNENEAKVVRRIFQDYLDGKSATAIARTLNEEDLPTKRKGEAWQGIGNVKGKWSVSFVQHILRNSDYLGSILLQKTTKDANFKTVKNKGQLPMYQIMDHHPCIIEKAMFDAVQGKLAENNPTEINKTIHPLSGMIFCGYCGNRFRREKNKAGNVYWHCAKRRRGTDKCIQEGIKESLMLEALDKAILSLHDCDQPIRDYLISLQEVSRDSDDGVDGGVGCADRDKLKMKLVQIERELEDLGSAVKAETIARRNNLVQERYQIILQIDSIKSQAERETEDLLRAIQSNTSVLGVKDLIQRITIQDDITILFRGGFVANSPFEHRR